MTCQDFLGAEIGLVCKDGHVPIDEAFHLIKPAGGTTHPDADAFVDWLLSVARQGANGGQT
jgi:hypothetical protein